MRFKDLAEWFIVMWVILFSFAGILVDRFDFLVLAGIGIASTAFILAFENIGKDE